MTRCDVVVLDVNETLSDLSPVADRFAAVGAPPELARTWFAAVLRDGFALTAVGDDAPFAELARAGLRSVLSGVVDDVDGAVDAVLATFASLPMHPDAVDGVRRLSDAGLRVVTLSNGSADVADGVLSRGGVRDRVEQVLSVQDAGRWKPALAAYEHAASACGVPLGRMMLVAVHPWDVHGAARAGLQTCWLDRSGAPYPPVFRAADLTVTGLAELAPLVT